VLRQRQRLHIGPHQFSVTIVITVQRAVANGIGLQRERDFSRTGLGMDRHRGGLVHGVGQCKQGSTQHHAQGIVQNLGRQFLDVIDQAKTAKMQHGGHQANALPHAGPDIGHDARLGRQPSAHVHAFIKRSLGEFIDLFGFFAHRLQIGLGGRKLVVHDAVDQPDGLQRPNHVVPQCRRQSPEHRITRCLDLLGGHLSGQRALY